MDRPTSVARKSVGAKLVAAREEKTLERDEAARRAGVPLRFATMLEEGDYPLIADPAYLVPYLRRYAASLGLVPDSLVLAFHAENEAADRAAAVQIARLAQAQASARRSGRRTGWIGVVVVLLAVGGGVAYAVASGLSVATVLAMLPSRGGADAVAYSTAAGEVSVPPASVPAAPLAEEPIAPLEERPAAPIAAPEAPPSAPERVAAPPRRQPPLAIEAGAVPVSEAEARPAVATAPTAKPRLRPTPAVVAAEAPAEPARPSTAVVERPDLAPPALPASRAHRLQLTATARQVWVWVAVDGGRRKAVELREGKSATFEADREILLSLDDAGGVDATLDGRRLPPLGPLGQTRRNVRFP